MSPPGPRRGVRYVVEVDKPTLDYVNELRDRRNERNPGAMYRQKDIVRYLTEVHRAAGGKLAAALDQEEAQ